MEHDDKIEVWRTVVSRILEKDVNRNQAIKLAAAFVIMDLVNDKGLKITAKTKATLINMYLKGYSYSNPNDAF